MSFHFISKFVWFFLQPSSFLLLLLVVGAFLLRGKRQKLAKNLLMLGVTGFLLVGMTPLAHILTIPLENRFPAPDLVNDHAKYEGLIILGGASDTLVSGARKTMALTEAAERLVEPVAFMKSFPKHEVIFSGGGARIVFKTPSEAKLAKRLYQHLGLDVSRLHLENKSRNTYENAVFTKRLLDQKGWAKKRWLLMTSAAHMPRAMGCFRKAGINVTAYPVDYRTRGWSDAIRIFSKPSSGLKRFDMVMREWIGLFAYRLAGRTDALFPG